MKNAVFWGIISSAMVIAMGCGKERSAFDVQGHRGARAVWPENSLPGFVYAAELGVTTLELDVVVTAAGEVVVSHEPWLNADICTGPDGEPLEADERRSLYPMPLDELQRCDCGSNGHARFPKQQSVRTFKPTLAEVVHAVAGAPRPEGRGPVAFNIEIKHEADWVGVHAPSVEVAVDRVLAAIRQAGIAGRTTVQSFSAPVLEAVHAADAGVRTAWLMEDERTVEQALGLLTFQPDIYSPYHGLLTEAEVARARALGLTVVPWTVNEAPRMAELVGWGVDGLISDDPALLLQVIGQVTSPASR